jgi:hypothetical protein
MPAKNSLQHSLEGVAAQPKLCKMATHPESRSCYTLTCQHCHACKEAHRLQQRTTVPNKYHCFDGLKCLVCKERLSPASTAMPAKQFIGYGNSCNDVPAQTTNRKSAKQKR